MGGAAIIIKSEAEWTAALEKATAEGKVVSVIRVTDGKRNRIAFFFSPVVYFLSRGGVISFSLSSTFFSMRPP